MPPSASSKAPWRVLVAPVKAPFSWPKSSLSISVLAIAPQSTTMNGPSRAAAQLRGCVRATRSLPVPVSPSISTVASVGAIRSRRPKISRIAQAAADQLAERSASLGRISMRSSNGWNLSCDRARGDHRAGAQVRLADLGAVEEGAVGRLAGRAAGSPRASRTISKWTRETVSSASTRSFVGRLADADHVAAITNSRPRCSPLITTSLHLRRLTVAGVASRRELRHFECTGPSMGLLGFLWSFADSSSAEEAGSSDASGRQGGARPAAERPGEVVGWPEDPGWNLQALESAAGCPACGGASHRKKSPNHPFAGVSNRMLD